MPYSFVALLGIGLGFAADVAPTALWTASLVSVALSALLRPTTRRLGVVVLIFALSVAAGSTGREPDLSRLDLEGPVVLLGTVDGHPRGLPGEHWLWLDVRRVEQRGRVVRGSFSVLVGLPDGEPRSGIEFPTWGESVRIKGYLRNSSSVGNRLTLTSGHWRLNLPSWRFWKRTTPPLIWHRIATRLRGSVERRTSSRDSGSLGSMLRYSLLVGHPDRLPAALRSRLRATGLGHLLAVSGLHVGLLAGWLWIAGIRFERRLRWLVVIAGVLMYLLIVGPRPSALRASGMIFVSATALLCRRPPQALNAAALWATCLMLWDPQALADLGFRLSVAATLGILMLGPSLVDSFLGLSQRCGLKGRPARLVCQGLAVSVAAQLATLPFSTPTTSLVHPVAPVLNLLAIPWLTVFLGLSFLSLATPWTDPIVEPCLDLLAVPIQALARLPSSVWTTLPSSWTAWDCMFATGALLAVLLRPTWSARLLLPLLLLFAEGGAPGTAPVSATVRFSRLDVGQGDALLLRDGVRSVLVDGGGWPSGDIAARILLPSLAERGIRRLDAVVMTHPDTDHCRGLLDLSYYIEVEEVWSSAGWHDECVLELLTRPGPAWRSVWRGDQGRFDRWNLEVLWPPPGVREGEPNDRSLILRASAGRSRILLAADAGSETEHALVTLEGDELQAKILGVGHHGSKTSSSQAFLEAVTPSLATIGVGGRNPYGHPHPAVVRRLEKVGARIHRTDWLGSLDLKLDPRPVEESHLE
ncbi:MAG: ComEC/Rec2 family competence protein [Thermoanaerobaculia bacterium]|nr:ComEC/Rec2 family competence protein [Thermoanaerobaculia bacterium]